MLKHPSRFVAAALVTACLLALVAALGGFLLIDGVTRTALAVQPGATHLVHPAVGASGDEEGGQGANGTRAVDPTPTAPTTVSETS